MKIKITEIENKLNKKIKRNIKVIGMDIASRTGLCIISVGREYLTFEWMFVEFDKTTPKSKYKTMIEAFETIISEDFKKAVIEDTHLSYFKNPVTKKLQPQVNVLKQLTRYGSFAISKCVREGVVYELIGVKKSRANFNIKCKKGKAKDSVALWLKNTLSIELDDNDVSDAIVIALNGVVK